MSMIVPHDIQALTRDAARTDGVRKSDLQYGDCVLVTTRNSLYRLCYLGDNQFRVSGGWFDREAQAPATTTINGCTWGGRAIHGQMVAAPGLFLEFGNAVVTTRIQDVRVLRAEQLSSSSIQ